MRAYHRKILLQRHEEVRFLDVPEAFHIPREEKGLLQCLGQGAGVLPLGLPDCGVPGNGDSSQPRSPSSLRSAQFNLLGDILSTVPADYYYHPHYVKEMNTMEKLRLEKILGRKISNEAFVTYCTREDYEREQGISQSY